MGGCVDVVLHPPLLRRRLKLLPLLWAKCLQALIRRQQLKCVQGGLQPVAVVKRQRQRRLCHEAVGRPGQLASSSPLPATPAARPAARPYKASIA